MSGSMPMPNAPTPKKRDMIRRPTKPDMVQVGSFYGDFVSVEYDVGRRVLPRARYGGRRLNRILAATNS